MKTNFIKSDPSLRETRIHSPPQDLSVVSVASIPITLMLKKLLQLIRTARRNKFRKQFMFGNSYFVAKLLLSQAQFLDDCLQKKKLPLNSTSRRQKNFAITNCILWQTPIYPICELLRSKFLNSAIAETYAPTRCIPGNMGRRFHGSGYNNYLSEDKFLLRPWLKISLLKKLFSIL